VTKTEGTLDDLYFEWLYKQVGAVNNRNPKRSYWELCRQLYRMPFIWSVPNDDGRDMDGKDLRDEFIIECSVEDVEVNWLAIECSMLEMLIALSRRASFLSSGEPGDWFYKFLENLKLRRYNDSEYNDTAENHDDAKAKIHNILERLIYRTYNTRGVGGLFPLKHAEKDQRKVEIWYQMSVYLRENNCIEHGP